MTLNSSHVPTTPRPRLPQEIIDLIIDHVASDEKPTATLRSCSLASSSLRYQSRRHLLSHIKLVADKTFQKRAGKLLKFLEHPDNAELLVGGIHSLKFVFDVPSVATSDGKLLGSVVLSSILVRSKKIMRGISRQENATLKALEVLSRAMLESFTLKAQGGFLNWKINNSPRTVTAALLAICSNPFLKSLHISNISNFPQSLIIAAVYSPNLTELSLSNVELSRSVSEDDIPQNSRVTHSRIQRLELRGPMRYSSFFSALRTAIAQPTPSQSPSNAFPHLRSLSTGIPTDGSGLSDFVLGVAHSLETLELDDPLVKLGNPFLLDLAPLTALRILKFRTIAWDNPLRWIPQFNWAGIVDFLGSATHPSPIESITIRIAIVKTLGPSELDTSPPSFSVMEWSWGVLDEVLARPMFVNLSKIDVRLEIVFFYEALRFEDVISTPQIDAPTLLPLVSSRPSVSLSMTLDMNFSTDSVSKYLYQM
ncbi:hypothetical protein BDZ97DRAFT_1917567 [Flammula alnicola]|nr:hypothetical protein BDZ97DRAFT_1917567 [Flammula alnicola]